MAIDFTKSYPVIEWDLNNYHFFTKYFGKKEENAKGFKVQIMQDGEVLTPTTETLRIYCKKKDGNGVYIDSSTVVDTYYIINLTNQVYSVVGLVECELQLNSNNKWLYSPTFGINVDNNLMDGSIVSSNDFIALQNALSRIDRALTTDNIVNNTVTTVEGTVLDGRMGKNIQDQVSTITNNFADGTWTPIILGLTVAGTNVYSTQVGHYAKIGNTIICWFTVGLQTKDINMQGTVLMGGIPFQADPNNAGSLSQIAGVTFDTGRTALGFRVDGTFATFYSSGSNIAPVTIDAARISNGMYLRGTVVYKIKTA